MDNGDHNSSLDTYKSYESDATDDSLGKLVIDEGTDNSPSNNKTENKSKILDKIDCSTNNDYNVMIKEISCDSKEVIKNNFENDFNNTEIKNLTSNNGIIMENNLSEKNEGDQNSVNGKDTLICSLDTIKPTETSENDQFKTIFTSTTTEPPTTTHNNNITTNSSMKCHNFSKNIFTEFSCNSTNSTTIQKTKQNNFDKKHVYSSKKADNLKNKPTFDIKNLCNNFSSFKHIDNQTNNIIDRNKHQKGNKIIDNNYITNISSTDENFVSSPTTTTVSENNKNKLIKNNDNNNVISDNAILNNNTNSNVVNNNNNTSNNKNMVKNTSRKEIVDFPSNNPTSICVNNNNNFKVNDSDSNNYNANFVKINHNTNSDIITTNDSYHDDNNNNNNNNNNKNSSNIDFSNNIDTNTNNDKNNINNNNIINDNNIKREDSKVNDMKDIRDINPKNNDGMDESIKNINNNKNNKVSTNNIKNINNDNINNNNSKNNNNKSTLRDFDGNTTLVTLKEERCYPINNISIKKEKIDDDDDNDDSIHHIKEERNSQDINNNNFNNIKTSTTSNNDNNIDEKSQAKEMRDKKPKINMGEIVGEEEDEDEDEYYIENIVDGFSLVSFSKLSDLEHFIKHTEKTFEEECRRRMMASSTNKDARSKKNQKINKKQPTATTVLTVLPKNPAANNNFNTNTSNNSCINNNSNNNNNNNNNNNGYKMSSSSSSSNLNKNNNKTTNKKGRAAKENNNVKNNTRKKRKSTKSSYYYEDDDSEDDDDDDDASSDATVEENIDQSYMEMFRESNNNTRNNNNNNTKSNKYDDCVKKTFEDSNSGMENYENRNKLYNNNNATTASINSYNQGHQQHFLKRQGTSIEYNREQKKLKIDLDSNNNLQASPAISIGSNNNSKTFSPKKEVRHRSPTPDDVVLVLDDPNQTGVSWVRSFPGLRFSNDQQLKTNSCLDGCARTDVTYDGSKIKKRNRYSSNMSEKKLQQHNNMSRQKPLTKMPFKQTTSNRNVESSPIDRLPPFKPFVSPQYNNTPSYNNYPPNHNSNYNNPGFCIPMPTIPPPPIPAHQQTSFFMNGWNQFELLAQMANQEMLRVQQGLNERFLAGGGEASSSANAGGQNTTSQSIRPVPVLGSGINIPVALPGLNNGMAPTLTLRTEMHQHLHHHQHVIPTYPPTNPTIPSLTHVQPPIQPPMYYQAPNNLFLLTSSNLRPSFGNRGAFVPMADQRSNQLPASQMLAKFRDGNWKGSSQGGSTSGTSSIPVRGSFKGKWCSTHVQLAWRILMHTRALKQHNNNNDEYTAFNKNNNLGGPYDSPYNPPSTSFYSSPYNASFINSKKSFLEKARPSSEVGTPSFKPIRGWPAKEGSEVGEVGRLMEMAKKERDTVLRLGRNDEYMLQKHMMQQRLMTPQSDNKKVTPPNEGMSSYLDKFYSREELYRRGVKETKVSKPPFNVPPISSKDFFYNPPDNYNPSNDHYPFFHPSSTPFGHQSPLSKPFSALRSDKAGRSESPQHHTISPLNPPSSIKPFLPPPWSVFGSYPPTITSDQKSQIPILPPYR